MKKKCIWCKKEIEASKSPDYHNGFCRIMVNEYCMYENGRLRVVPKYQELMELGIKYNGNASTQN